jgi:poly [ADP-ribose] polymerase
MAGRSEEGGWIYWFDAVLNQCNIMGSSNNNKYYRLQVLHKVQTGHYACWQKWGRVGEAARKTTSKFQLASTQEAAIKIYAKKFKDKTGHAYDADAFVPKKGKYTVIEIDNNVPGKISAFLLG